MAIINVGNNELLRAELLKIINDTLEEGGEIVSGYRLLLCSLRGSNCKLITRAVLRLECSLDCLSAPTYRYIAPRMIQRIILKFCGYVGCDDATNVSNFGYEPIKFNQLNQ